MFLLGFLMSMEPLNLIFLSSSIRLFLFMLQIHIEVNEVLFFQMSSILDILDSITLFEALVLLWRYCIDTIPQVHAMWKFAKGGLTA